MHYIQIGKEEDWAQLDSHHEDILQIELVNGYSISREAPKKKLEELGYLIVEDNGHQFTIIRKDKRIETNDPKIRQPDQNYLFKNYLILSIIVILILCEFIAGYIFHISSASDIIILIIADLIIGGIGTFITRKKPE